jgi:hypothetical protein
MRHMNLPDELFQRITESITIVGHDAPQSSGERRAPRVKLQTHVAVFPWSSPIDALSVRVRDISIGGIGILHARRMALDEQFVASLPCGGDHADEHVLLLYTVVYWEPLAEDLFAIGARFERIVSEEELTPTQPAEAIARRPTAVPQNLVARLAHAAVARVRLLAS